MRSRLTLVTAGPEEVAVCVCLCAQRQILHKYSVSRFILWYVFNRETSFVPRVLEALIVPHVVISW